MRSREIIRFIEADGWYRVRQRGDHIHFKHPSRKGLVTVVHPVVDMPIGTLKDIERKSGVTLRHRSRQTGKRK